MNHQAEHIHAYLSGLMSAEDTEAFKKEIEVDDELRSYFILCKELYANFNENDWNNLPLEQFKEEVKVYETYYKSNTAKTIKNAITDAETYYFDNTSKSPSNYRLLYKAIAIAAVLCAVYLGYRINTTYDASGLYADYKNWEDLPSLTLRGQNNENLVSGERYFKEQDYKKASLAFNDWIKTHPEKYNSTVFLYLGISYLEIDATDKAINIFSKVTNSESLDASKAYWYLALTYLKTEHISKAKEVLKLIIKNPSNSNFSKAKELLKKIETL